MSSPTILLLGGWREAMAEHKASCTRSHPVVGVTREELERIRQVLGKILYRDWKLISSLDAKGVARMQVYAIVPDCTTGQPIENRGRSMPLCPEMSDEFIADLAFELIKEYEMHEAAERFRVEGTRVYCPHRPDGAPVFEVPSMRAAPSVPPAAPVGDHT